MGISITTWRARIGSFNPPHQQDSRNGFAQQPLYRSGLKDLILLMIGPSTIRLLILVLLIVGNVERNPGPLPVFKCPFCIQVFTSMAKNAQHQKIHSAERNFRFSCPGPTCWLKFSTYSGLSNHLKQFHEDKSSQEPPSSSGTNCIQESCNEVICGGSRNFCSHLIKNHLDSNETIQCPFKSFCKSTVTFKDSKSFRSHLSIKHPGWVQDEIDLNKLIILPNNPDDENFMGDDDADNFYDAQDFLFPLTHSSDDEPIFTDEMFVKHVARFYLMLAAECFLADTTIQTICEHITTLSELIQYSYKEKIVKALEENNVDESKTSSILNAVLPFDMFYAVHHKHSIGPSLTSDYLRKEYYNKHFDFVPPEEVDLIPKRGPSEGETVQQIPIKKTLELLLRDQSVKDQIEESFREEDSSPGTYKSYRDGEVCKKFCGHVKQRIDLILFQDGFSAAKNALGSAANRLKACGTYFTIGNLKSEVRCKVSSINLALLVEERLLKSKKYGPEKCFEPLVNELKDLMTNGVMFNGQVVPVFPVFITGDSLGAHVIGGFIESFSSDYFCRFCEMTKDEFHRRPCKMGTVRTRESYEQALQDLKEMKKVNKKVIHCKGIKRDSPLNKIPGFHVTDPRLPPCLGHDCLENGVVSCDFKLMISYFVSKQWFNYKILEELIDNFSYKDQDLKNKPAPVPNASKPENKTKLGGHAIQNWYLLRLFPFIIEKHIKDPQDKVWLLYLRLKRLLEYVTSPSFSDNDLVELDRQTKKYFKRRERDLPGSFWKPKYHFFKHYFQMVKQFGPLIYVWTMRFEAKHQFFKRIARVCNNTINIGYTMARRHQVWFSYFTSGVMFPRGIGNNPKLVPLNIENKEESIKKVLQEHHCDASFLETNFLTFNDVEFRTNRFIILGRNPSGNLEIGCVKVILIVRGQAYLVLEKHVATEWPEYGLYCLNESSDSIVITSPSSLQYPLSMPMYKFQSKTCFSLKHKI